MKTNVAIPVSSGKSQIRFSIETTRLYQLLLMTQRLFHPYRTRLSSFQLTLSQSLPLSWYFLTFTVRKHYYLKTSTRKVSRLMKNSILRRILPRTKSHPLFFFINLIPNLSPILKFFECYLKEKCLLCPRKVSDSYKNTDELPYPSQYQAIRFL